MINGIINVYKEKGFTSHDVVAKLRGIAGQKKIGHTGTLDPEATGVLPVCLGRATKVCDLLTDKDKIYEAVMLLGRVTDTQDTSGEVIKESDTSGLDNEKVIEAIKSFEGEYDQLPPMYSALKVNGKKLYELAREGKVVERKTRKVNIFSINIKKIELPRVTMEVHCSKGTYIRTLCNDIGEKLGVGGCMEELIRTKVSRFEINDSVKLSELQKLKDEGRLEEKVLPVDEIFEDYKKVVLNDSQVKLAYNGNPVPFKVLSADTGNKIRAYDENGNFIGLYKADEEKRMFRLEKMFLDPEALLRG